MLKKATSVLLSALLLLCLCGCEDSAEEEYIGAYTLYHSSLLVDDTLYGLFCHDYLTASGPSQPQFELVTLADGEATSLTFFPTGVTMRFHPEGKQCLCIKDSRLLSYTLPDRETKTVCEVGEGASIFCVTEHFVLLDNGTMVDLRTAEVLSAEHLPSDVRVMDVLEDCIYFWYDSGTSACRYDCTTDTVTTLYSRERNVSIAHQAGIVWGDRYLYCEGYGLYAVPLGGEGEPELAIQKPTRILAMARGGDDLYLAADTPVDRIGFYRLTSDGTVTELAVWEESKYYYSYTVELLISDSELICANRSVHGGETPPEVFRLPLPKELPPEEPVRIEVLPKEGRAIQAEYDLPEEVFEGIPDDTEAPLKLAAYPDSGIALYHVYDAAANKYDLLVEWDGLTRQFDISALGTGGIDLRSSLWDADGDGADELLLIDQFGTGTGVSVKNLHVIEKAETGLFLYSLHCDILAPQMREWVAARLDAEARTVCMGGSTFCVPEHIGLPDFAVGNIVSFEADGTQIRMGMDIQFWLEGRDFRGVSAYTIRLTADVLFSDSAFTLQNFSASEHF